MFNTIPQHQDPNNLTSAQLLAIEQSIRDYTEEDNKIKIHSGNAIPQDLAEVVHKYSKAMGTLYVSSNSTQCQANRRRSIEDLYWLLLSYGFTNLTFKNARDIMASLTNKGNYSRSYCSTVLRWVYARSGYGLDRPIIEQVLQQLNIQNAAIPGEPVLTIPQGMTLATITEQLNDLPAIRVQGLLKKREETMKEFLIKFFNKWNATKPTVFVSNGLVQTQPAKRRSLGDIYKICKYYYPKSNLKQVRNLLYTTLPNEVTRFRSSYCNQIHKRVWYIGNENQGAGIFDKTHADEYGLGWQNWLDME